MLHPLLKIGPRINVLPVVHGSGDFAWEVRRVLMNGDFDCLAVPLPASFQELVEAAVLELPKPSVVYQRSGSVAHQWDEAEATPEYDRESNDLFSAQEFERSEEDRTSYEIQFEEPDVDEDLDDDFDPESIDEIESEADDEWEGNGRLSYVPIDPCQPVIAAIRTAMGEHIPRKFIDLETDDFETYSFTSPDPYSLKEVRIERFAAAMLPNIPRPDSDQRQQRIKRMAYELRQLSIDHENILLVCHVLDWPWIREAYFQPDPNPPVDEPTQSTVAGNVDEKTYFFMLGELPYITSLYEEARQNLDDDSRLSIDGIKQLLITARDRYNRKLGTSARKITPLLLRQCLQYIRNLTLMDRRLTPDLFTIIRAVQQVAGDTYAFYVLKTARKYWVKSSGPTEAQEVNEEQSLEQDLLDFVSFNTVKVGIDKMELADGEVLDAVSRLPGPPIAWSHLELRPKQDRRQDRDKWMQNWNPYMQCSWPPEDERIERFRSTVFDRAKQIIGADAARSEKFTTSVQDGIDIRETLRHWYDGDLYVKIHPPVRGGMDCVIMLFDTPADPRQYRWRATWFAEHEEESTLAFFATPFENQPVGPGICVATYGGALFLFPPRNIPDIWRDRRFDFATTLEERLIAAGCKHAECRQVALLSPVAPGHNWRKIARMFGKTLVHVPLGQFSDSTIQQLRIMHVLNGKNVRSYAADFIRRS